MCTHLLSLCCADTDVTIARKRNALESLRSPVAGTTVVPKFGADGLVSLSRPSRLQPMFELPAPTGRRVTLRTGTKMSRGPTSGDRFLVDDDGCQ